MWIKTMFQIVINSDNIVSVNIEQLGSKSKCFNIVAKMIDGSKFILHSVVFDSANYPDEVEAYQNAQNEANKYLDDLCNNMNSKKTKAAAGG